MGTTNNSMKNTGMNKSGIGGQTISYLDARKRADELVKTSTGMRK